jgi:hypothetical protein
MGELCTLQQAIWIKLLDIWRVVNLNVVMAESREGVTFRGQTWGTLQLPVGFPGYGPISKKTWLVNLLTVHNSMLLRIKFLFWSTVGDWHRDLSLNLSVTRRAIVWYCLGKW